MVMVVVLGDAGDADAILLSENLTLRISITASIAPTLNVIANGRLFNTASSCFAESMTRLLQTAAVAVLAVQRFGGECLRRRALATAFGPSMIDGINCSNRLQSIFVSRLHVRRAVGVYEFACSI